MSKTGVSYLALSEADMIKAGVTDMSRCVKVIEETFDLLGKGDYLMGGPSENSHGLMIWFPDEKRTENMPVAGPDRRFMGMVAYLGGRFNLCGNKWYGSNVANKEKGLPRSILMITLNDVDTGAPLCFASGNLVSSMRTGAVPGVATKYLQSSNAKTAGIVGAGVISHAITLAIAETLNGGDEREIKVYDIIPEVTDRFCKELGELTGIKMTPVRSMEECVRGSDIISVAASGAHPAEIKDEWLKDGAVVELTGCADIDEETYKNCRLVFDDWKMHLDWLEEGIQRGSLDSLDSWAGSARALKMYHDGKLKGEDMIDLGDIVNGKKCGRKDDKEKIIFIAGGLPVEDVAWCSECYYRALEMGLGQKIAVWEEAHWA